MCHFLYGFQVIAQHEDVFIVCFHEVALAGYLRDGLRVTAQLLELRLVALILCVVFLNLLFQFADLHVVFEPLHEAVLVEEADNEYAHNEHNPVLVVAQETV